MNHSHHAYTASQLRAHAHNHLAGDADSSMFYGDPVVINDADMTAGLQGDAAAKDIKAVAASKGAVTPAAAAKVAAFEKMSPTEQAGITKIFPLAATNAVVVIKPVTQPLLCSNLNLNLQRSLLDNPFSGTIVSKPVAAGQNFVDIDLDRASLGLGADEIITIPFVKIAITASNLNARPGGNYTLSFSGESVGGTAFPRNNESNAHSFRRVDATQAMTLVLVPFTVQSTRTVPVLLKAGDDIVGQTTTSYKATIHIEGLQETEVVTVTVLGYATSELEELSKLMSLPAGFVS